MGHPKTGQEAQFGTCGGPDDAASSGETIEYRRVCPVQWLVPYETEPQGNACMALSRTALVLLMLPFPAAAVYLATSMEDVNASGQCLPSAEAVRKEYPGSWASWTIRAPNHKGERCWFPAMRENHSRHFETALRRAAQKLMHNDAPRQEGESGVSNKAAEEKPVASAAETNQLGWSLLPRSGNVGPAGASSPAEKGDSSFEDRFAPARSVTSVQKPSIIQRMMDPVGAIPNIP